MICIISQQISGILGLLLSSTFFAVAAQNLSSQYGYSNRYGYNGGGTYNRPSRPALPPRPPYDLTIPSYMYVPERITGHMQYLPNQPIYSAEGVGPYVGLWTLYQNEFHQNVPAVAQPTFDPVYENPLAYIDGHPVTPSTSAAGAGTNPVDVRGSSAQASQTSQTNPKLRGPALAFIDPTLNKNGAKEKFRPCAAKPGSLRFGVCVSDSKVTELCVRKVVVRSVICGKSQSCCLDNDTENTTTSVESAPSSHRKIPSFATSLNTDATDQLVPSDQSDSFKSCRSSSGFTQFGICVNDRSVTTLCTNKIVERSVDCAKAQSCCIDGSNSSSISNTLSDQDLEDNNLPTTVTSVPTPTTTSTARPVTNRLRGSMRRKVSASQSPPSTDQSVPMKFTPCVSFRDSKLGICVPDNILGQLCVDQFITKSASCSFATQSCCIENGAATAPDSDQDSFALQASIPQQSPNVRFRFGSAGQGNPRTRFPGSVPAFPVFAETGSSTCSDGDLQPGICVANAMIPTLCIGKALSQSSQCRSGQSCCTDLPVRATTPFSRMLPFFRPAVTTTMSPANSFIPCRNPQMPSVLGICIDNQFQSQFCSGKFSTASQDCYEFQSCCLDAAPPLAQVAPTTLAPSEFAPDGISLTNSLDCTTPQHPLQSGRCVPDSIVPSVCGGKFISKSKDCGAAQTCCTDPMASFADQSNELNGRAGFGFFRMTPPTTTTRRPTTRPLLQFTAASIFQQCIPIVNNFEVGLCVDESQVSTLCAGRLVAPSRSCTFMQSCCSYFPEVIAPLTPPPTTTTTTTTTTATTTPEPAKTQSPFLKTPNNRKLNYFRPCVATNPDGITTLLGVCIQEESAMDYCTGKVLSPSDDCEYTQLCCSENTR
ncbi:mucin-5AC-like [Paramacrobiotus metropolitanus]|uniref:mucin-5AC-like n=1 Tax=Paramacrobiotus metropolitanus TaxID=2943436 RepID=UPI002445F3A6|nr:mucin-5AC-like [Paramacrobiotus metropolitanus]